MNKMIIHNALEFVKKLFMMIIAGMIISIP